MEDSYVRQFEDFLVDGINEDLTEEEVVKLNQVKNTLNEFKGSLKRKQEALDNFLGQATPNVTFYNSKKDNFMTRKLMAVDVDYNIDQQLRIFNHGKSGYKIWFLNSRKSLCVIDKSTFKDGKIYCTIMFNVKESYAKTSHISLNNFLYLVQKGDFYVVNKQFRYYYLQPYERSHYYENQVKKLKDDLETEKENFAKFVQSYPYVYFQNKFLKKKNELKTEAKKAFKFQTRNIAPDPAKQERKSIKLNGIQTEMKSIWNSYVSKKEKAYLLGWLCKHLTRITIKVVEGGVSDKVISKAYPDEEFGTKYKEKPNSSGWDASSGKLSFNNIENAPIEIINKLSTVKHEQHAKYADKEMFKGNTLSNLDLCLFLLSRYAKYGMKSGIKFKDNKINVEELKNKEFKGYEEEFEKGYGA